MPSVISAPSAKLMPQASASLPPVSAVASPPPGKRLSAVMIISTAATSSATPMPRWIARLGMPVTIAAPIHEPPIAARISSASVVNSTCTSVV